MIETQVKKYVKDACARSENVFGKSFFEQHLLVVAEYGDRLADKVGGDKEIIHLATYLHDISAVKDFSTLPNHAVISGELAQDILMDYGYPQAKIDIVKRSISNHVTPIQLQDGLIEEVCLSNADAISQIINPAYWLYFVYCIRKMDFDEGRSWLIDRVESNWDKLIIPAKELIEEQYLLVKKSFGF